MEFFGVTHNHWSSYRVEIEQVPFLAVGVISRSTYRHLPFFSTSIELGGECRCIYAQVCVYRINFTTCTQNKNDKSVSRVSFECLQWLAFTLPARLQQTESGSYIAIRLIVPFIIVHFERSLLSPELCFRRWHNRYSMHAAASNDGKQDTCFPMNVIVSHQMQAAPVKGRDNQLMCRHFLPV